jgi:hypothetical protein
MPHPPGPYEAVHHRPRDCEMQPEYWTIEGSGANGKSRIVADTLNCDCTMDPDVQWAIAKLFAAAPDLLTALTQLVGDWESIPPWARVRDEINVDEHWDAARDAIAKATK